VFENEKKGAYLIVSPASHPSLPLFFLSLPMPALFSCHLCPFLPPQICFYNFTLPPSPPPSLPTYINLLRLSFHRLQAPTKGRNEILVALGHQVLREGGGREGECVV